VGLWWWVRVWTRPPPLRSLPVSPSQSQKQNQKRKASSSASSSKPWVRISIFALVIAFAFSGVLALIVSGNDSGSTAATTTTTRARKPCVAVSDPLPAGAPAVPVQVGEPPTQLVTQDLEAGTGATVAPGATVTVDYIGVACSTGKIFDSSYSRGAPVTFSLTGVIPGWSNGIPGMKVGGTRLLGIPPDQAYGDQGSSPDIAPGETLWFVVKVENTQ
jgi:FKBP-type peptidyl-prolyl cis-trans isomerase